MPTPCYNVHTVHARSTRTHLGVYGLMKKGLFSKYILYYIQVPVKLN